MAGVHVTKLHKAFPDGTVAVEELSLEINDGELFVMLGPSGCGKTTTLRCIAGLEEETGGEIRIGDEVVTGLRPSQRDIAMVFQFYALYPHLSVRENMAFPLRAAKRPESEVNERVAEAAKMLQLEPYLTRKPSKLSGGEQQRVALGRAMVRHPKAFLMDEPLTNLDAELRAEMRAEVKHLQQRLGATMIYVTHDQTEAMALGDRIAILNKGNLEQLGAPMEVYNRPASLFAARFIGSPPMNLIEAEVTNGHLTAAGDLQIAAPEGLQRGQKVIAGVRPEGLDHQQVRRGRPRTHRLQGGTGRRDHLRRRVQGRPLPRAHAGDGALRGRAGRGGAPCGRRAAGVRPDDGKSGERMSSAIVAEGISKSFGEVEALKNLELDIPEGSFFVLLGPSGAGKTTTLRVLAGLETPDVGNVFLNGINATKATPAERDLAMVFQSYALYPKQTAAQNIASPLRARKLPKSEIDAQLKRVSELLHIEELLNRYPARCRAARCSGSRWAARWCASRGRS